jgi:hypothetical protein
MADEAQMAKAMRTQQNYESLKDMPAFNRFIQFGGRPRQSETGMDASQYQKFIEALEYGQSINSDMNEDLGTGLGGIEGIDTETTVDERGDAIIRMKPSRGPRLADDEFLPRR